MTAMWIFKHRGRTGRYKDEVKGEEKSRHLITRSDQHQLVRPCVVGCMWLIVLLEVDINV